MMLQLKHKLVPAAVTIYQLDPRYDYVAFVECIDRAIESRRRLCFFTADGEERTISPRTYAAISLHRDTPCHS
jgi:hypothetical protein